MNDFELHTFGKGWLKNIRFNKYCFPSLTDRKANKKKTTIKIPVELSAKIVLDNNIISASIFVVITPIVNLQASSQNYSGTLMHPIYILGPYVLVLTQFQEAFLHLESAIPAL